MAPPKKLRTGEIPFRVSPFGNDPCHRGQFMSSVGTKVNDKLGRNVDKLAVKVFYISEK